MDKGDWEKVVEAVSLIDRGVAKRIDIPDTKIVVYSCGSNVIRIDIKK